MSKNVKVQFFAGKWIKTFFDNFKKILAKQLAGIELETQGTRLRQQTTEPLQPKKIELLMNFNL